MPTTEIFWNQMGTYNEATLTIQIVMMVAAVVLTYFIFAKANTLANTLIKVFIALAFAWNGIVFFLIFTSGIISMVAGALFIIIAILFIIDSFRKKTEFRLPAKGWQRYLTFFWIALVFLYPVIGIALGHYYPETCLPVAPCPLTVFAIALMAAAIPYVERITYIFLLPWAILGLPKCLGALDCYEDCILFAAGVYGLVVLIINWKIIGGRKRNG